MKSSMKEIEFGSLFLSGNEAVARGAWEYGVHFASAYPGTPSTEILETIGAEYPEIKAQWAPNEKVAMETIAGASFAGARVLTAMKHVGLNVAADPFFTLSYIGATAGIIIVSADDPGMHSSQNEQDNRLLGKAAKVVILEPSDSQEAKDMVGTGLELSEKFDTPVLLRLTTRISHSKSLVDVGPRTEVDVTGYKTDIRKRVPIPAHARIMHKKIEERLKKLSDFGNTCNLNKLEERSKSLGIITSGISYCYVREIHPEASVLKLGMTYPLPWKLIDKFIRYTEKIIFVEEGEPFLEEQIRAKFLIPAEGKKFIPIEGELNPAIVRKGIRSESIKDPAYSIVELPLRPPSLCPGCPHRGAFYALNKLRSSSTGDIGCYTLGLMPPHNALETVLCMGAAIGVLSGIEKATGREEMGKLVAAIGDSTFVHSGITGLIDMVYNCNTGTVMIMDNSITAMTGGQQNPSTGKDLIGNPAPKLNLEKICRACGVKHVTVIDPHNLKKMSEVLKTELAREELSVIITQRPCIMTYRPAGKAIAECDTDKCVSCKACMKLGCPAISFPEKNPVINELLCYPNCNLCVQVCPTGALSKELEEN